MYHVSAQGVDERMINVHYYYYNGLNCIYTNIFKQKTKQKQQQKTLKKRTFGDDNYGWPWMREKKKKKKRERERKKSHNLKGTDRS